MIYVICFVFSVFFTYLAEQFFKKNRKVTGIFFSILAILLPCILAGTRDSSVGTDVEGYVQTIFESALDYSNIQDFINANNQYTEEGYLIFTYGVAQLGSNIHLFLFIIQLMIMVPLYIVFYDRRDKAPMWLSMAIYFGLGYNISLNLVRQAIAMSFILLSYAFFEKRKYLKTLLMIAIAVVFHKSTLLALPIYLVLYLYTINISKKKRFIIIANALFITVITALFYKEIVLFLCNVNILPTKYYVYVTSKIFVRDEIDISWIDIIYKIIWIICYVLLYLINRKKEKNKIINETMPYFILLLIDLIILPISFFNITLIRIGYYYGLNIYPIIVPYYTKIFKQDKNNQLMGKAIIILLIVVYWTYSIAINHGMGTYPYIYGGSII